MGPGGVKREVFPEIAAPQALGGYFLALAFAVNNLRVNSFCVRGTRGRTSAHGRTMQDHFSGRPSCIQGSHFPGASAQGDLLDHHGRRLAALDRLRAVAAECGLGTDPDRDLLVLPEDAVSLLEGVGGAWADLGDAIRAFRATLPLLPLDLFGFPAESEDSLAEGSAQLRHIGGGVEAWAFEDREGSIYKFFRPIEAQWIGATFRYEPDEDHALRAEACPGSYRDLLEKLDVINAIGGMPTEVVGVTPEGVLVVKQVLGERLPEGTDTSELLPPALIAWPSRFLRCDRDHPRLAFVRGRAWLVADPHDRNVVRAADGSARIIDVVAAPVEGEAVDRHPLLLDWLQRVKLDPAAPLLAVADDADL
ncbi:MAG: hypothetical protein JWQ83_2155 [Lacunisphaera sp.]|nr:hypothetical protein [Lacunisphaera sp.]